MIPRPFQNGLYNLDRDRFCTFYFLEGDETKQKTTCDAFNNDLSVALGGSGAFIVKTKKQSALYDLANLVVTPQASVLVRVTPTKTGTRETIALEIVANYDSRALGNEMRKERMIKVTNRKWTAARSDASDVDYLLRKIFEIYEKERGTRQTLTPTFAFV